MSDPTAATMQVFENAQEESDANVAAPPRILVSVRNGVRVVSKATVPNTVSNVLMLRMFANKCASGHHH
jgi:hypothetical protein